MATLKVTIFVQTNQETFDDLNAIVHEKDAEAWFDGTWKVRSYNDETKEMVLLKGQNSYFNLGIREVESPVPGAAGNEEE